jgi:hypothetical protein
VRQRYTIDKSTLHGTADMEPRGNERSSAIIRAGVVVNLVVKKGEACCESSDIEQPEVGVE